MILRTYGVPGPFVVAVSGGIDSTALLLAMKEAGIPIVAAHVNHHLRGAESDEDEAFVRRLCQDIELHVCDGTIDPDAIRRHGLEAAAREVRNARLHEVAGDRWIATAHQKNDQAETVLMRLMTGGGIAALRGIHPVRDDRVIRPLLEVTRAETEAFLRERGISARIDSSNADPRFLRNRIRRILWPEAVESLAAVAAQAREQWAQLEKVIDEADTAEVTASETRFTSWPDDPWLRRALLHRHIRRLDPQCREVSAADLERLAGQLDSLKRVSVTKSLELLRRGELWILRQRVSAPAPDLSLRVLRRMEDRQSCLSGQAGLPVLHFELPKGATPDFTVRNRKPGDRFQPLGMKAEKKLKDFLIDRKIAVESRDRLPLLLWNGKIVCVAGVEVSESFKVTGDGDLYEVAIEESQKGVQREADRQTRREART